MSLKLEALSAIDGAGIIRSGETLRLLRPPYVRANSPILPEESIQDAILRHGFSPSQQEFSTWDDAIGFLNQQITEARRAIGQEIPDSIPTGGFVEVAPVEVLEAFLKRIETDLIPQGKTEHAERVLFALLTSESLLRFPPLVAKATELLRQTRKVRERAEMGVSELESRDRRFPSLARHGALNWSSELAENIKGRRCIFVPCS
jgi:hypothetical protein